jgi:DNA-binding response OmpR family regulator
MVTEDISAPKINADKARVLVVDDEYGPRESVAFTLSTEFDVDTADRASEALGMIKNRAYSAVVMDIRMPEMDGIRALEELRKIDPAVSVIMLTGYGTLQTAQQAMIGGANQYLRKPPDVDELVDAVRKQALATRLRRHQGNIAKNAEEMNIALKHEIETNEPHIWQGKASVELVHDLNNPLTVVIGYSTLLADEARSLAAQDPERLKKFIEYCNIVEKAAEYCHHISENWRMSARKIKEFARLDLVQTARDVRNVVFFGNVAIETAGVDKVAVLGSKFELMRVFQNIFKNSIEAGATKVTATFTLVEKNVEVSVVDNGGGMDDSTSAGRSTAGSAPRRPERGSG